MHIQEAYAILDKGEPSPEEHVDLVCPSCAGEWAEDAWGVHSLGDQECTIYKYFVGNENCCLTEEGYQYYSCPNGCTDSWDNPVKLQNIHELGQMNSWNRWDCARLMVKAGELENELDDVRKQLRNYDVYWD